MWTMHFTAFCHQHSLFTLYPNLGFVASVASYEPGEGRGRVLPFTLAANHRASGEHYAGGTGRDFPVLPRFIVRPTKSGVDEDWTFRFPAPADLWCTGYDGLAFACGHRTRRLESDGCSAEDLPDCAKCSATTCSVCKNFKFLVGGRCVDACPTVRSVMCAGAVALLNLFHVDHRL